LLSAGLSLLGNLAQTAGTRQADTGRIAETFAGIKIEQNKTDGRPQLKIPLPPKETLVMIADILQEFAKRLYDTDSHRRRPERSLSRAKSRDRGVEGLTRLNNSLGIHRRDRRVRGVLF